GCKAHKKEFEYNFAELEITGRSSKGITVTKYPIKAEGVKLKEAGRSTLAGKKICYDDKFGRLNTDDKGEYLGMFNDDDRLIAFYHDGSYEITDLELTQKFDNENLLSIRKFDPDKIVSAVYVDAAKKQYMVKRFKIETSTLHNKFIFIKEGE